MLCALLLRARGNFGFKKAQKPALGTANGWLPHQANRFCVTTNRVVAIETREITYLGNSRTADSFLASALCGGAIGKPDFDFPRARIRDIEPRV